MFGYWQSMVDTILLGTCCFARVQGRQGCVQVYYGAVGEREGSTQPGLGKRRCNLVSEQERKVRPPWRMARSSNKLQIATKAIQSVLSVLTGISLCLYKIRDGPRCTFVHNIKTLRD